MRVSQFKPYIGDEEYAEIQDCFTENWITEGSKSLEFSERLLELTGAKYGVFVPNGTLAIYLGLRALNIGPGDEVIVPDFTFIGTATAVEMTGATPVFTDVNRKNFQIDLESAESVVREETKAIIPVHIYGTSARMDDVMNFAAKHGLKILEDAAQAIGIRYQGKHAGTFGDAGTFSFFADKTITTGEGGFIVTDDADVYENLLYLRNQGRIQRGTFIHPQIGYNFRITDIQAAIGIAQLIKLPDIIEKKAKIAQLYIEELSDIDSIQFFSPEPDANYIPFRIGILAREAHQLMDYLRKHEIETRTFFYPLHQQPCFAGLKQLDQIQDTSRYFQNSIFGYEHGVCLPTYPTLRFEEIEYVCSTIRTYYER